jgi:putative ABC transport system permease protein
MNYLTIAWRNLWRNKRRTFITVASIFFGVLLATLMNSLQDGTYENMIDMMVKLSSGYLQVQDAEFRENRSINNIFYPDDDLLQKLESVDNVTTVAKRLESFALISSGPNTRGGAVIGIEPGKDRETSNLANWISHGNFLREGDDQVIVTSNVAKHLGLEVNDTVILISQGYRGVTAAGMYPIRGILTFTTPQMNNLGVFIDVSVGQELFSTEGRITSLMVMVEEYNSIDRVQKEFDALTDDQLIVVNWQELNPELVQIIESDKAGSVLMLGVLYIVIGFGIFGTIIMMVAERKREFAVMVAVGMQKYKLGLILFFETVLIGIIGVLAGFVVSVPVIFALVDYPVRLPGELADAYIQYGFEPYFFFGVAPHVLNQMLTVFIITLIISIYPLMKTKNMVVSKSLKS